MASVGDYVRDASASLNAEGAAPQSALRFERHPRRFSPSTSSSKCPGPHCASLSTAATPQRVGDESSFGLSSPSWRAAAMQWWMHHSIRLPSRCRSSPRSSTTAVCTRRASAGATWEHAHPSQGWAFARWSAFCPLWKCGAGRLRSQRGASVRVMRL